MIVINNLQEFESYIGKQIGISDWHRITQEQINRFADATLDRQWIHIDPKRAADSPFKSTIAHGYLTLSMLTHLWLQIADVRNVKMMVNYGVNDLKFNQPVHTDNSIRLRVDLKSLTNLRGIIKAEMGAF